MYNWEMIVGTIRELQPEVCIFSIGEPDCRWVGNEDGLAPGPCWKVVEAPQSGQEVFPLGSFAASYPWSVTTRTTTASCSVTACCSLPRSLTWTRPSSS